MSPYKPLSVGSVRLLRLLPHLDENSRMECQLVIFPHLDTGSSHPYEALSYVWGPEDKKQSIFVNGSNELRVTANLHVALSHLRYCVVERLLWIDAICINQEDDQEKGHQVECMAKIYAKASRVIVWLGETADNSDQALKTIRVAAAKQHTNPAIYQTYQQATLASSYQQPTNSLSDETNREAILTLLDRKWFQRIWVVQEVGAARHILIKCGSTEIDGNAFCLGLSVLKPFDKARPDLQALIPPIARLIRGAAFRQWHDRDDTTRSARFSLDISPLSELLDMYHTRKATIHLDKVYALLGMSSDDPHAAGLGANYTSSWKNLFQKLVNFCLSNQVSVSTWDDVEVAVIEAKGYILGEVSSTGEDANLDDMEHVEVTWKTALSYSDANGKQNSHFAFQASTKTIKKGDVICLLQGASRPTIIRPCNGLSTIIRIAGPSVDHLTTFSDSLTTFTAGLLLIWDWDESGRESQDYEYFVSSRGVPKCPRTKCRCQDHLDKAARLWKFGILLNQMERYDEAVKNLRNAVGIYRAGAALRSLDNLYPGHSPWREADKKELGMMDNLLIHDKGAVIESKDEDGRALQPRDASNGHEAVVQLLLATGKAHVSMKDEDGRTPLLRAAENGCEAVAQLLLATGKADVDAKDEKSRTPLLISAGNGYQGVVRLLLATGKVDVDAKDCYRRTPLSWAAGNGHEAVVRLLLATSKVNVDVNDKSSRTPLSWAAGNGYEGVVRLLMATGKVTVDAEDNHRRTPLSWAAENGNDGIVRLLMATGNVDVDARDKDARTPLSWAAENGHEAVVQLLLATEKVDVDAKDKGCRTPLLWAAANGHTAVVRLLLATREVDVDAEDWFYGRTPLSWAAKNGHSGVINLLKAHGAQFS